MLGSFRVLFLTAILLAAFTRCDPANEEGAGIPSPADPEVDEAYFKAIVLQEPYDEVLYDTINHFLYVADRNAGSMVCYDYVRHKVVAKIPKDFYIDDYAVAIFADRERSEVFFGRGKSVDVYQGGTLEFQRSITVFADDDSRFVTSLEVPNRDILVVGSCNNGSSLSDKTGTLTINLTTDRPIDQAAYGDNCLRIRSATQPDGSFRIVGVGYATSRPNVVSDAYAADGQLIASTLDYPGDIQTSLHLLKTHPAVDYFITSDYGNRFSKDSLTYAGTLNGSFQDFAFDRSGDRLYALTHSGQITVLNARTFTVQKTIPLPRPARRIFLDSDRLVVVYFEQQSSGTLMDVYLSALEP